MHNLRKSDDGVWHYTTEGCGCCSCDYDGSEIKIKDILEYKKEITDQLTVIDQFLKERVITRLSGDDSQDK